MTFQIGDAIQIIPGVDIGDTVRSCGLQFAGSSDTAVSLALAARGIGIIQNTVASWPGKWYTIKWNGHQAEYGYDQSLIEQFFVKIPGIFNDPIPFL